MKLTNDERRALAFIAALLFLSAAVRVGTLPEPVGVPAAGLDLDAQIAATEAAVAEEERRGRPLGDGERLDPNTAPAAELDRLPGVGPALAERIIAARAEGRFRSAADLERVSGVGARTVERIAPHLSLPAAAPSAGGLGAGSVGAGIVGAGVAGARTRAPPPGWSGAVNVNTAGVDALTTLPGVGAVLARRIVAHRDSAGPFLAVDSLVSVSGIGPATLERLRPRVRVR